MEERDESWTQYLKEKRRAERLEKKLQTHRKKYLKEYPKDDYHYEIYEKRDAENEFLQTGLAKELQRCLTGLSDGSLDSHIKKHPGWLRNGLIGMVLDELRLLGEDEQDREDEEQARQRSFNEDFSKEAIQDFEEDYLQYLKSPQSTEEEDGERERIRRRITIVTGAYQSRSLKLEQKLEFFEKKSLLKERLPDQLFRVLAWYSLSHHLG